MFKTKGILFVIFVNGTFMVRALTRETVRKIKPGMFYKHLIRASDIVPTLFCGYNRAGY